MSTTRPITALTPSQVNASQFSQWSDSIKQALNDTRCATPAFLTENMDVNKQVVTVQIALQERVRVQSVPKWVDIPPIIMVPVMCPRGGGYAVTLPLKKGDEGMLIFCDTCIDFWWKNGQTDSPPPTYPKGAKPSGSQIQNEVRRHYVHDCGFYPGLWSQKRLLSNYSADALQIRSDDGNTVIQVSASDGVAVTTDQSVTVTATHMNVQESGGTPLALVNDNWFQWWVTNVYPFLVGLGYTGPSYPLASETTVLKGQ